MRPCALASAALMVWIAAAGCGAPPHDAPSGQAGHSSSAPASAPVKPRGLVIDVTIRTGTVAPTNAVFDAQVGKPIELRVSSDATDQLHVHAHPEHTFLVTAEPDQTFTFTVNVPGTVDVELHHLDRTVATIHVRP